MRDMRPNSQVRFAGIVRRCAMRLGGVRGRRTVNVVSSSICSLIPAHTDPFRVMSYDIPAHTDP
jgi:hypothetical protein